MTKSILGLLLALPCLVIPSSAMATQMTGYEAVRLQHWADVSKMPTPPGSVESQVSQGLCLGEPACAADGFIYMPVGLSKHPINWRYTFLHELGHEFDWRVLTDQSRAQFLALVGVPGRPWDYEAPGVDIHLTSPREYFAESFATCAEYGAHLSAKARTEVLPMFVGRFISLARYEAICSLILQVGDSTQS